MEQSCNDNRKNVLILELIQINSGLESLSVQIKELCARSEYLVSMLKLLREMETEK